MTEPFFFTWSAQRGARGLEIVGGDGATFETAGGERWLDFGSLSYQANLGHGCRPVMNAVARQAERLCLTMPKAVYPEKRELAERLLALAPEGFTKVFFTLGGSDANENALKMARLATGRYKVLSRYRSYHGATMGALSLTGDYRRPPLEPGLVGAVKYADSFAEDAAERVDTVLRHEGNVAAVFLEPVPGANGVLIPHESFWPGVREACDRHGALLVADEVLCGFGRTGRWFGFQHWDVTPDLITVSKALTGGYGVLGAVLVHERVARVFDDQVLYAGLTHYAHPLGVAAALAALDVYEQGGLIARSAELGELLLTKLRALAARRNEVDEVRGLGLLAALSLSLGPAALERLGARLRAQCLHAHLRAADNNLILAPPLCVTEAELDDGVGRIEDALREAAATGNDR